MHCYVCDKLSDNYETDKITCASCRDVFKIDLVRLILELDPVYLSESNRNKRGRKKKLTATERNDIWSIYKNHEKSMSALSKEYNVSKSTIFNIIHEFK